MNRAPIFLAARNIVREVTRNPSWGWSTPTITLLDAGIDAALALAEVPKTPPAQRVGLTDADFKRAMAALGCTYAQIRAVDEVESGGGWFQDVRATILDADGPGGFIAGPHLPKILFESHQFSKRTGGKFDASHPNLSTKAWNRHTYRGGPDEWLRLHEAMSLDRTAALASASVGRFQIMGFNHKLAGFADLDAYWSAMKADEGAHLDAFVAFVRASNLVAALRRISNLHADCIPFARGYNGTGYAAHTPPYNVRLARAHAKWS